MANSMKSPKNKFYGQITFEKPRKEIGSVVSFTSNDIDALKTWLKRYAPGHVTIKENKATYPSFDWQSVESYQI